MVISELPQIRNIFLSEPIIILTKAVNKQFSKQTISGPGTNHSVDGQLNVDKFRAPHPG